MEKENSYFDLLTHPEWQEKCLKIMSDARFECSRCGDKETTLMIYHSYYEKGLAPWEYPDESLHCLCEECYKKAQELKTLIKRQFGKIKLSDNERLLGYMYALESISSSMAALDVISSEVARGIGDCWGLSAEEVLEALQDGKIDGWKLHELSQEKERDRALLQKTEEKAPDSEKT